MHIRRYESLLCRHDSPSVARLRQLLEYLGGRGRLVGQDASEGDGLYGWLTPDEAEELISCAAGLDLPIMPADFDEMASYFARWRGAETSPDGHDFDQLSLRFIINVAILANKQSMGILWGNDFLDPMKFT
ncbi:MAG: hypothetical protein IPK97_09365 [Ahniella sp.]|nr:hypothetical protein [Ahniella sp.]